MPDVIAPTTAAEAAATLHDLKRHGRQLADRRDQLGALAARAEALYRKAEALGRPLVQHGRAADVRKQMLLALELSPEMSALADEIARAAGVDVPECEWDTVGDLRQLRDLTADLRDAARDRLRLHEAEVRFAQTVAAWGRVEYEQTLQGRVA